MSDPATDLALAEAAFLRGDFAAVRRLARRRQKDDNTASFDKLLWKTGSDRWVVSMAVAVALFFASAVIFWAASGH